MVEVVLTIFQEQVLRLLSAGLRMADTYCNLAETHSLPGHRADKQRVLQKARRELAIVRQRLMANPYGLSSRAGSTLSSRIERVQQRIDSLHDKAA